MKRFLVHSSYFIFPLIILLIIIWAQPVDDAQKWNRIRGNCFKSSCNFNVLSDSTNIDVAFIGSSRTICTINQTTLSQKWNKRVVNLGHCRYGRNLQFEYAKILFENHDPTHLFIEINQDEDWYGHFDYGNVASTEDLFHSARTHNPKFLRDLKRNFIMKFDLVQRSLFKNQYKEDDCVVGFKANPEGKIALTPFEDSPVNTKKQRRHNEHYLEKIIDLCNTNNCAFTFVYLPAFGLLDEQPHYESYYSRQAEIIFPPDSLDRSKYWFDQSHMVGSAAVVVTTVIDQYYSSLK